MPKNFFTVTENKMLSRVETLKEFRTILLGRIFGINTDNKNLICKVFNDNRVLIWRLILEEYGPYIEYIRTDKKW